MTARLPDWQERLTAEIRQSNRRPWAWGEHDCLAFAARAVLAVTGEDLFAPFRGRYQDEAGASALVPDLVQFLHELTAKQGWPQVAPNAARQGDLVIVCRTKSIAGVIFGSICFANTPAGLRTVARGLATTAWAVG